MDDGVFQFRSALLKIITDQNYFAHNNMFYTQTDGLPMGSPISGILAKIFIHTIEQEHIMNNNKYTDKIIYWHRYVEMCIRDRYHRETPIENTGKT